MTKNQTLAALAALVLGTAPAAAAQEHAEHGDHRKHAAGAHQHEHDHDHADEADAERAMVAAEGRTITARVHGMVCDFCARSLTKVLGRNDAVEDVAIDLTEKTVTIIVRDGAVLSDEAVREAVTHAGYNLAALERS